MNISENRHSAQILQFPVAARRAAVEASRHPDRRTLPDFVEFAMGSASYHDDAIREEAERHKRGH
ncbi:DUF2735 domain-containing protein [Jiella endophytica]|uniref:DUF2735 domain-containing protein n=1 Tax=Jiella endophytica TaxID=2558362 RepID=A0A4Y8RD20_9HYPH|nr:DUF2735 domain-containing protein [Jiella endophytica]TFF19925.1 DUF2735 domain-containing protein [Jiella endophytica]